ncbi:hypothetical protein HPG69_014036 [Diceros bicornis minor]|uniref:Uncharacterized protein n=1 Tax=Diceros bicornis minor TaxID=77932 RepID=A0A7J7EN30_DICBM|nr:hypothetical protein HPG69_014036 [Diceros bicornis minor]
MDPLCLLTAPPRSALTPFFGLHIGSPSEVQVTQPL